MGSLRAYIREGINVALIMGASDIIAQFAIDRRKLSEWDHMRTARFSAVGLFYVGPLLKRWYMFLESAVSKDQKPLHRGIKKMLLDQSCFAPIFTLTLIFIVPYINGEDTDVIKKRIKNQYLGIMARNYCLWPAAQIINFTFVPMQYQVIYAQCVALVWNCYLSYALN